MAGGNEPWMFKSRLQAAISDPQSALGLIWRLLSEYGLSRWSRYAIAFLLMAIGAGATAAAAYLAGDVVNQAYVSRNFTAVVQTSLLVMVVFTLRGAAVYGHQVILSRVGNSIVAENQRRMFDRLQQQNLTYFNEHHSSELLSRMSVGAAAASSALSMVVTAIGRDLLTLTALTIVMVVQDPIMSLFVFVIVPPIVLVLRKLVKRIRSVAMNQWRGGAQTLETLHETVQGIRLVKSFTLEDQMRDRFAPQRVVGRHRARAEGAFDDMSLPLGKRGTGGDDRLAGGLELDLRAAVLEAHRARRLHDEAAPAVEEPVNQRRQEDQTGQPIDDEEDYGWPVWAGVVPVQQVVGAPIPDPRQTAAVADPAYLMQPARIGKG